MEFLYTMMVEPLGGEFDIQIKFFLDANEFFEWWSDQEIDLLITDINLPSMNGIEIAQKLRSKGKNFPLYFISGYEEKQYESELNALSNYRYISKPINFDETLLLIEKDLGLKK